MKRSAKLVLVTLLAALLLPIRSAPAAADDAPPLGFHVARGDAAHLHAVRQAGGEFVAVVLSWRDIQPTPDRLYWEIPDAALRAADFYGLQVLARLDQPPDWALDGASPTPWDLAAYARFAGQVAQRYGDRLAGLILWNEPNLSLEWHGQRPDPAGYAALLAAAYPAVKAAAPDLPVLHAGLASTLGDGDTALDDLNYLQAVYDAGGGAFFDALAAHPYGFGQPPEQEPAAGQLNFRRIELLRAAMEANGDEDKPVWITEMGWRTSAPSAEQTWEVVTPQQQAAYTLAAIDWARQRYPWLAGIGLWELNGSNDDYGYALWEGPDRTTPAFDALARRTGGPPPLPADSDNSATAPVEILAPDVAIRLGDVGTLHPHWVHLHRGGNRFSSDWQGEFFLTPAQASQEYELALETMQVDQATNRVLVNGQWIGRLRPRLRGEATSTWVTQRIAVPAGVLRPGVNTLTVISGQRNPVLQLAVWRWENMMLRHARLEPVQPGVAQPLALDWAPLPSPGSWAETNRLRAGADGEVWLTGNRAGQIWCMRDGQAWLESSDQDQTVFVDVLVVDAGLLAATDRGLLWRPAGSQSWEEVVGAPAVYAYAVIRHNGAYYAGFEKRGLWRAAQPDGPWRPAGLAARTVHDILSLTTTRLAVATDIGVAVQPTSRAAHRWRFLPPFPDPHATGATSRSKDRLAPRLFGGDGHLAARQRGHLWRWDEETGDWQAYGPPELAGRLASAADCCAADALAGSEHQGVWQLGATGWRRLDNGALAPYQVTGLLRHAGMLYAATGVGLLASSDGQRWVAVPGLAPVVTDLITDPADPGRWIAGTPAGVFRSMDRGASWQAISPPWRVYALVWGAQNRLFVAHGEGLAWSDDLAAAETQWQEAAGLERVTYFDVAPHPEEEGVLWAGTWGNNVAVSSDGGATVAPLHNGLETLSALDVLWHPTPGQVTIATIEGLYRTDDGGASWFKLPGPLMQQTVHSLLQTDDGVLWAGAADGLWRSEDYGANWQRANGLPAVTVLRLGTLALPDDRSWLWAGTEGAGLWLSEDGGATWRAGGLAGRSVPRLLADPAEPGRLLAATDAGLFAAPAP